MRSPLACALLGLLSQAPRSGYDLKKLFAATPMGRFSDSPGSIYPALHRLEQDGLVRGVLERAQTLRPRKVYRLSRKGGVALDTWLRQEVRPEDVVRHGEQLMLRFAFMDGRLSRPDTLRFLRTWARETRAYVKELEGHLALTAPTMSFHGRLALQRGIQGHRSQARWLESTIVRIREQKEDDS